MSLTNPSTEPVSPSAEALQASRAIREVSFILQSRLLRAIGSGSMNYEQAEQDHVVEYAKIIDLETKLPELAAENARLSAALAEKDEQLKDTVKRGDAIHDELQKQLAESDDERHTTNNHFEHWKLRAEKAEAQLAENDVCLNVAMRSNEPPPTSSEVRAAWEALKYEWPSEVPEDVRYELRVYANKNMGGVRYSIDYGEDYNSVAEYIIAYEKRQLQTQLASQQEALSAAADALNSVNIIADRIRKANPEYGYEMGLVSSALARVRAALPQK